MTIFYPHFDLEAKRLIQPTDHVLNIKLLSLLSDKVLVLPSHLLDVPLNELTKISEGLGDFFADGKIVTSIYEGQGSVSDYFSSKIESIHSDRMRDTYRLKTDYLLHSFLENPHTLYRDNEREKEMFQEIYQEANRTQAARSGNTKLIHSASVFNEEFSCWREKTGQRLTIQDVEELTSELLVRKKIYKAHRLFLLQNMIGSYYYCGSFANSAIVACNPYFIDIGYASISRMEPYRPARIYDPAFLLNVLMGLRIVDEPAQIISLSSKDVDEIRNHEAWENFKNDYAQLYSGFYDFKQLVDCERDKAKKIEKTKDILFDVCYDIADTLVSELIGLCTQGWWGLAAWGILFVTEKLFGKSKVCQSIRNATTDAIIDRTIQSREPLYVVGTRIRRQIDLAISKQA